MKTALICHHDEILNREGVARFLASVSDLVLIIVIEEPRGMLWKRLKRERKRVGLLRLLDVVAYRIYHRIKWAKKDQAHEAEMMDTLVRKYPAVSGSTRSLTVKSPNSKVVREALTELNPDVVIARCKSILSPSVFEIPAKGTYVIHPGICPEYRNSHGCFWAIVNGDFDLVGATFLRIDQGIDTGPVFAHYYACYDTATESHITIQDRVVIDNLESIIRKLEEIVDGKEQAVDVTGRHSSVWGQPWLTKALSWIRKGKGK
jgi:methionyl-tRNA formyltransferase